MWFLAVNYSIDQKNFQIQVEHDEKQMVSKSIVSMQKY